jgi:hypothetical protein
VVVLDMAFVMPALRGWSFERSSRRSLRLAPNEAREVCRADRSGWLLEGCFVFDRPGARVRVETSAPDGKTDAAEFSPDSLLEEGLLAPTPRGVWCSRYDDTAGVYAVELKPAAPLFSVDTLAVYCVAPAEPATVLRAEVSLAVIVSPEDFVKSLGDLLGSTAVGGYLAIAAGYLDSILKQLQRLTGAEIPRGAVPLEAAPPREVLAGGLVPNRGNRG